MSNTTLIDTIICAASEAWRHDGEVLATGIGIVPRLAASLAMLTCNRDLLMTDSEAWVVSEPGCDFSPAGQCTMHGVRMPPSWL